METELNSKLFSAADSLRSKMDASEYKNYLLGLIFYKYLSDKLLEKVVECDDKTLEEYDTQEKQTKLYRDLLADADTKSDLIETLVDTLSYDIEPDYLFSELTSKAKRNLFQLNDLKKAFLYLSTNYSQFTGLFDDVDLSSRKLGADEQQQNITITEVLKKLNDVDVLGHDGDVIGDAYEFLIGQFASEAGKKAGEFYTPHEVSDMMARIATIGQENKKMFSVYDPTMGSGSLMLNIRSYMDKPDSVKYHGQELNTTTYNLAKMNLILHGIDKEDMRLRNGDTLNKDWPTDEPYTFDSVLMNPPYSAEWSADTTFLDDSRFNRYDKLAPKSKADFAFLLHGFYHLKDTGTMAIVLPHGVLFRGAAEGTIRKKLLDDGSIDAVIGMPPNLFFGTSIPTTVIILKKNRGKRDVLFIDASSDFVKEKNQNKLTADNITKIVDTYNKRESIEKYARLATFEDIKQNDYNLNIPKYINRFEYVTLNNNATRKLKEVANLMYCINETEAVGVFLTSSELEYPLVISKVVQKDKGLLLKYGDIIMLNSGRKYLYYEQENNIYFKTERSNLHCIIRPITVTPQSLYLFLETYDVTQYINSLSQGVIMPRLNFSELEDIPIVDELPKHDAHSINFSYREIFENNYCSKYSVNNLSNLLNQVEIISSERNEKEPIFNTCISLVKKCREGIYWDYKLVHHNNNAQLLHDIICMANNIDGRDAYIIFGVEDKTGRVIGIENDTKRKQSTHFDNILKTAKFAYGNRPKVRLETFSYKNHELDVLVIEYGYKTPYFLTDDYSYTNENGQKIVVKNHLIYSRESDSNTPINSSASLQTIEHLWFERFTNKNLT